MTLVRTLLAAFAFVLTALGTLVWWTVLDSSAPKSAHQVFEIESYRALVADDDSNIPTAVQVEFVTHEISPKFAAEAGRFGESFGLTFTSFQLASENGNVIIGGAADRATAEGLARSETAKFYGDAYGRIEKALTQASAIVVTHEHLDHVMAIARHPTPAQIAPALRLTAPQIKALPKFAPDGELHPALESLRPLDASSPVRVAPGVVVHAVAGHSAGSVVIYTKTTTGKEYLFIGDIVWTMSNIENLKGKPRFLKWVMPDFHEDQSTVLKQIRALHDLQATNPDLTIVPSHDDAYLRNLVSQGDLIDGIE